MTKRVLAVTLNPAIDKFVTVPGLEPRNDSSRVVASAGGKGINVARALSNLGIPVIATGFLAGPTGRWIEDALDGEDIDHDFCHLEGMTRINLTVTNPLSGKSARFFEKGPVMARSDVTIFRKKFVHLLKRCCLLVVSGRPMEGKWFSLAGELITLARKRRIIAVLDTSGSSLKRGIRQKPFAICPNDEEAREVWGSRIDSMRAVKRALWWFYQKGIPQPMITMGSFGSAVFDGRRALYACPPKVSVKSSVGCGDAFLGGFVASFLQGRDLRENLLEASACGTANATQLRPGHIDPRQVRDIKAKTKILEI